MVIHALVHGIVVHLVILHGRGGGIARVMIHCRHGVRTHCWLKHHDGDQQYL